MSEADPAPCWICAKGVAETASPPSICAACHSRTQRYDDAWRGLLAYLRGRWKDLGNTAATDPGERLPLAVLAGLAFLWVNAALLRTLHQWFGVAHGFDAMLASTVVQTSLSIFWALIAFTAMLVATRQRRRIVWLAGASLLGVVIAKLFLVDLSRVGSIERIVSFVGVGVIMLVVGYLSPLPPAARTDEPST